jgi:predicted ATPase
MDSDRDETKVFRAAVSSKAALLDTLCRGRLVGRDAERAEIRERWRRAREGSGHCVLLSGEAGVGKTRLAREALSEATLDGAETLLRACDAADDEGFDEMARGVGPLARPRGLLVCIDDLELAGGRSLRFVGDLLRSLCRERVLLVLCCGEPDADLAGPLSTNLDEWCREGLATRIALRPFGPEGTRAMLSALLGEDVSEELAGAFHAATGGNPLFVEEALHELIEQGAVRREGPRWRRAEVRDLAFPRSLGEAVTRRVDRVRPECADVLRAASVLGRNFEFRELLAVNHGHDEDRLRGALAEAVDARLLAPGPGDSFTFAHEQFRRALYDGLHELRRRRLRRRAAVALEGRPRTGKNQDGG